MFAVPKRYIVETLAVVAFTGVVVVLGAVMVARAEARYEASVRERIAFVRGEMQTLATLVRNNRADETTAAILGDCDTRQAYEEGLDTLLQSTPQKLATTEYLFLSCGYRDAVRKEVMTMKFEDTLALLVQLNELLTVSQGVSEYDNSVDIWKNVVARERERSALLGEQVRIQGEVIVSLRKGMSPDALLEEAKEIQQSLEVSFLQLSGLLAEEERVWSLAQARSI